MPDRPHGAPFGAVRAEAAHADDGLHIWIALGALAQESALARNLVHCERRAVTCEGVGVRQERGVRMRCVRGHWLETQAVRRAGCGQVAKRGACVRSTIAARERRTARGQRQEQEQRGEGPHGLRRAGSAKTQGRRRVGLKAGSPAVVTSRRWESQCSAARFRYQNHSAPKPASVR